MPGAKEDARKQNNSVEDPPGPYPQKAPPPPISAKIMIDDFPRQA